MKNIKRGKKTKFCVIGTGDAGAICAYQLRHLDDQSQIEIFSQRRELGIPPCEIPLVLRGDIQHWDNLIRGFRGDETFYDKRNIKRNYSAKNLQKQQKKLDRVFLQNPKN